MSEEKSIEEAQSDVREDWKQMTDKDRLQTAKRTMRKIRKWRKKNPQVPLSQTLFLMYEIARRVFKDKGKYREGYMLPGATIKAKGTAKTE